jgi:hypothetical protein
LLAKLYKVTAALNLKINEAILWTDSSIVLSWIQWPSSKWKTFVGNRVATIQEDKPSATWGHVLSQSNPADLISRRTDPICNPFFIYHMVERTTMVVMWTILLAQPTIFYCHQNRSTSSTHCHRACDRRSHPEILYTI